MSGSYSISARKNNRLYTLTLAVFGLFVLYRLVTIFYPQPDAGGVEVNIIYFVQRILDGLPFYTDPEQPPYAIAQYSPLYYYLVAGAAKLTGTTADDPLSLFIISRSVSLVLNLVYIMIVYRISRRVFAIHHQGGMLAATLAFIFLEITSFSRPDSLNHVFFMLTLYVFMCGIKQQGIKAGNRYIILSAILAGIALFAKQTSIVLPILLGSWLFWQKQYRQLFIAGLVYLLTVGIFLLLFHFITGLPFFYKNVIQGVNNGIGLTWFRTVILPDFYYSFGLLFVLAFLVLVFELRKQKEQLSRFVLWALVVSFILLNGVALKHGSNPGYFTEWWTLLFITAIYCWQRFEDSFTELREKLIITLACFTLIIKAALLCRPAYHILSERPFQQGYAIYQSEKAVADYILGQLAPGDEHVVFLNYYTADSYLGNLLFRHAAMPQMDIVILASYPLKQYNYSDFAERLRNGKINWMIMWKTGAQQQFFDIKLDQFRLVKSMYQYNIYQYQPKTNAAAN